MMSCILIIRSSGTYSYDLGSYLNKQNYTMSNPNMTYDVYELELF